VVVVPPVVVVLKDFVVVKGRPVVENAAVVGRPVVENEAAVVSDDAVVVVSSAAVSVGEGVASTSGQTPEPRGSPVEHKPQVNVFEGSTASKHRQCGYAHTPEASSTRSG